jgi:hypothetical protein
LLPFSSVGAIAGVVAEQTLRHASIADGTHRQWVGVICNVPFISTPGSTGFTGFNAARGGRENGQGERDAAGTGLRPARLRRIVRQGGRRFADIELSAHPSRARSSRSGIPDPFSRVTHSLVQHRAVRTPSISSCAPTRSPIDGARCRPTGRTGAPQEAVRGFAPPTKDRDRPLKPRRSLSERWPLLPLKRPSRCDRGTAQSGGNRTSALSLLRQAGAARRSTNPGSRKCDNPAADHAAVPFSHVNCAESMRAVVPASYNGRPPVCASHFPIILANPCPGNGRDSAANR